MDEHDAIIIGGGPAGLTAGIYASRAGLRSLLIERGLFGGQMVNATLIENYPGFPQGISGLDLASLMHEQASKYGLEMATADVTGIQAGSQLRLQGLGRQLPAGQGRGDLFLTVVIQT